MLDYFHIHSNSCGKVQKLAGRWKQFQTYFHWLVFFSKKVNRAKHN